MSEDMIYRDAETKEERQKLLDKFFRVVCLQVCRIYLKISCFSTSYHISRGLVALTQRMVLLELFL